jgi:beta-lactamase class A
MTDTLLVDPVFHSMIDDSTFECKGYQYINSRIGQRESILKLTEQMIDVSDNLATNLLITLCDARKITGTARMLGATTTLVLRCVMDIPAFDAGLSNRVSPRDLGILMEAIETNRAAGEESCLEMRRILLAQEHREMIPARLPEGVRVANKTGAIEGIQHDAAIVYAPFGTYYLVLMSDGLTDSKAGIAELARLSRFIYDERERLGSR